MKHTNSFGKPSKSLGIHSPERINLFGSQQWFANCFMAGVNMLREQTREVWLSSLGPEQLASDPGASQIDRSNTVVSRGTGRGVPFYQLQCRGRPVMEQTNRHRSACPAGSLPWHTGQMPSCQARGKGSASPGKCRPLLKDSSAAGTGAGDHLKFQLHKPPECGTSRHHLHSARPALPQLASRSGPQ